MNSRSTACLLVPLLLLGLLGGGYLGACGSTPSSEGDAPTGEHTIGEGLTLRDPRTGQADGTAYLELTLVNPTSDRVKVHCAPEWYDAQGAVVAAPADWQAVDLKPGGERRLRFLPMPASARSWRLRFGS